MTVSSSLRPGPFREANTRTSGPLDRLRQFPAITLTKGSPRDRDPADTVATTWQVSLERVQRIPGALALLEVCAFLGPEEIPRDLDLESAASDDRAARVRGLLQHAPAAPHPEPSRAAPPAARWHHRPGPLPRPAARPRRRRDS